MQVTTHISFIEILLAKHFVVSLSWVVTSVFSLTGPSSGQGGFLTGVNKILNSHPKSTSKIKGLQMQMFIDSNFGESLDRMRKISC